MVVIDGDITYKEESDLFKSFINYRDKLKNNLSNFIDNFKIPFKESDFLGEEDEPEKYFEVVYLMNPVLILNKNEEIGNSQFNQLENEYFDLNYSYEYDKSYFLDENKDKYMRVLKHIYRFKNENSLDMILNHFHSVFIFFHRSGCFYKELESLDSNLEIITIISDKLNSIWPQERLKLLLINRFKNMELYNKTFFAVLELTSQLDSLLNKVKNKKVKLEEKYKKQFERVLHNFGEEIEEIPYYKKLIGKMYSPLNHRNKIIEDIENFFQPTDSQIERLRSVNDSKVNFAIQWIMSVISIIIIGWGIIIVVYENTVTIEKSINDIFLFGIGFMPSYLVILIAIVIISIIIMSSKFIFKNSHDLSKNIRKIISSGNLSVADIRAQESVGKNNTNERLYVIISILTMITTYMIVSPKRILNQKIEVERDEKESITHVSQIKTIISELEV